MSQGSFEDHHHNENANNNTDNNNRGENDNENTNREHSEEHMGVARDTLSNRDRDTNTNDNASEQPLFNNATELIARAPPMGFRIPGTAAGEGVARAHAAGNVLPDILRAKRDEFRRRVSNRLGSGRVVVFVPR